MSDSEWTLRLVSFSTYWLLMVGPALAAVEGFSNRDSRYSRRSNAIASSVLQLVAGGFAFLLGPLFAMGLAELTSWGVVERTLMAYALLLATAFFVVRRDTPSSSVARVGWCAAQLMVFAAGSWLTFADALPPA